MMASSNHLTKVAIVGAGGNLGSFITNALLNGGKHTVTAITRDDSQTKLPEDGIPKIVDYSKPNTLVDALRGQEALVITISGQASMHGVEEKLIRAAGEAGVPWVLPNEWSPDTAHEGIVKEVPIFGMKVATRKFIEETAKSSYISIVTGFWYEFCLAMPHSYGFDFTNRTATFFDEGETKISTSTWPQIGRGVAALLSLPIKPEESNEVCLENFQNKVVYINSFTVSQRDMMASALRATGTKEQDWNITKEAARERFSTGLKEIKEGNMQGYAKLSCRIFFNDGCGNFESKGTLNKVLGLPEEDIDEATKAAVERQLAARERQ